MPGLLCQFQRKRYVFLFLTFHILLNLILHVYHVCRIYCCVFLQVISPSIRLAEEGTEGVIKKMTRTIPDPPKEVRLEKTRLDTEVQTKEKQIDELKNEMAQKKKEKEDKESEMKQLEKEMNELATKVEEALDKNIAIQVRIRGLKAECAKTDDEMRKRDIAAEIQVAESEHTNCLHTIGADLRLDSEWRRLNEECISLIQESSRLNQKRNRLDLECDELRSKLGKLLEAYPSLLHDASKQSNTVTKSNVCCVSPISCICVCQRLGLSISPS